ncbi:MAG: hypothetical protein GEEBNDBF_02123 [bacterium]|nr:hypothetical protein [bacterium]
MALEPNMLLAKLFQWVFKSKEQLFDADIAADLMQVSLAEAHKALKALVRDGKLDSHGDAFALHGAKIEGGAAVRAAAPAPAPAAAKAATDKPAQPKAAPTKTAPVPVVDVEDEEELVEAPPPVKAARQAVAPAAINAPGWVTLPAPAYTWVIDVADALVDYVQERNRPDLNVSNLASFAGPDFADVYPDETDIESRIFQILELFATLGILTRDETPGSYLAHPVLVEREQVVANKLDRMDIKRATKREYTIECAVPYTGLKGLAVLLYGNTSFIGEELTFATPEGTPYIEVHHIQRLAQGGNESLENLCLLNPFHHKWCHFSTEDEILRMQQELQGLVKTKLEALIATHIASPAAKSTAKAPVSKKTAAKGTAAKKTATKAAAKPAAKKTVEVKVEPIPAKKTATKAAAKPAAKKMAAKKTAAKAK